MDISTNQSRKLVGFIYAHPLSFGFILSILTGCYLYYDYGIINRSSLLMFWALNNTTYSLGDAFSKFGSLGFILKLLSTIFGNHFLVIAKVVLLVTHAFITVFVIRIAQVLNFSRVSCWALIFLLLSNPNYNDFRANIIDSPFYWLLWLIAIDTLLRYYKSRILLVVFVWLFAFLLSTLISIDAWLWLFLFPIGILLWPKWRSLPVFYALLFYLVIGGAIFFLPILNNYSPYVLLSQVIADNYLNFTTTLTDHTSPWLNEEDWVMASLFVFSGAASLVILRLLLTVGAVSCFLLVYAFFKKQVNVIDKNQRNFIFYIVLFDILCLVLVLVFSLENTSGIHFSSAFILIILASLGLSYIFRKIYFKRYPNHIVLIIIWCMVAYFASGMLSFGPKKVYLKDAGYSMLDHDDMIYSNSETFLFYAGRPPIARTEMELSYLSDDDQIVIAYALNRNRSLPDYLKDMTVIETYRNNHNDKLIIFKND